VSLVVSDVAVTMDGYASGVGQTREKPFGDLDQAPLHGWIFDEPYAAENAAEVAAIVDAGAFIMGRNMFGHDLPLRDDGIHTALDRARAATARHPDDRRTRRASLRGRSGAVLGTGLGTRHDDRHSPRLPPAALSSQESFSERAETRGMSDGPRILIVDDEPNIRDLLTTSLRFAGFAVRAVGNGAQAISAVLEEEPDLIILDVMLPDMNGFGVTKRLRASGYTAPILFLTAKDDTEDKITGLTVGGDDYVTKPFSLDEIVARLKAILRRTMHDEEDAIIRAGELTMDQDTHEVAVGEEQIELSPTEFKLLRYLMLNPNRVLSKAQILDHVWEYDFNGDAGIVESYISYLRRKLDQHSTEPMIQTKRGFGYMLKTAKA
jgi:two-component system OmpR family response regulator